MFKRKAIINTIGVLFFFVIASFNLPFIQKRLKLFLFDYHNKVSVISIDGKCYGLSGAGSNQYRLYKLDTNYEIYTVVMKFEKLEKIVIRNRKTASNYNTKISDSKLIDKLGIYEVRATRSDSLNKYWFLIKNEILISSNTLTILKWAKQNFYKKSSCYDEK